MHDCGEVESKLIDLLFDEVGEDERLRLLAEIESCPECLGEYNSGYGTIRIFDRAAQASLPADDFWPQHHEMLRQHLALSNVPALASQEPFWKRFFALRLHVPAPVAVASVICLLTLSILAFRPSANRLGQTVATQQVPTPQVLQQIIEVPVVREKLVTRTIYVEKTKPGARNTSTQLARSRRIAPSLIEKEDDPGGVFTPASFTGYRPPDELRIRVIKRNKSYEK